MTAAQFASVAWAFAAGSCMGAYRVTGEAKYARMACLSAVLCAGFFSLAMALG